MTLQCKIMLFVSFWTDCQKAVSAYKQILPFVFQASIGVTMETMFMVSHCGLQHALSTGGNTDFTLFYILATIVLFLLHHFPTNTRRWRNVGPPSTTGLYHVFNLLRFAAFSTRQRSLNWRSSQRHIVILTPKWRNVFMNDFQHCYLWAL